MEGTPTDFVVDTVAEFSVLKEPLGKLRNKKTLVIGATSQNPYSWTTDRKVDLGRIQVTHSFLVIPECPTPFLRRDLISKLKAQISFSLEGTSVSWQAPISIILALKLEKKYRLDESQAPSRKVLEGTWLERYPQAWAETGGMGETKRVLPIDVNLKTGGTPIGV